MDLNYHNKVDSRNINTLCFSGGGALGLAYAGVVEELAKRGILDNTKTFVGSSAGSIISMVLALGYEPAKVIEIVRTTEFAKFLDAPFVDLAKIIKDPNYLTKHPEQMALIAVNLFGTFAMCAGEVAREWLQKLITDAGFNKDITFRQLKKNTGNTLIVTVCDLAHTKEWYVNPKDNPDIKVLDAVNTSMSIPFVFRPRDVFNTGNRGVVDGGTVDNYPVTELTDWLGFILETKESVLKPVYKPINTIFDYISGLVDTLRATKYNEVFGKQENIDRTIFIDPLGLGSLDFDMSPEQKEALVNSGKKAVQSYFKEDIDG